ncbi:MAG: Gfo/Idh/MocA family oxidoreductase, partial [Spirochaetia bacterium]|nr:Gfo/Idh/MocA family oxidoreductase [Spirochaetia bacterium]
MSKKMRIGFIGAGKQAQSAHVRNYAMLPDCEMVAIADLDEDLAQRVAARWNIPKAYANATDMVAKEKLDGLVVTLQPGVQGRILPDLLASKIPIAAEKPLAGTLEDGEKVEAAVRSTGTWLR